MRESEPLVSFVMPAYEPRPDWLLEAVASVLGQTWERLELIVVDDGSARPVADLLANVDDPRLRILRAEHGGYPAALNAGIAQATGSFVRFVDADDVAVADGTERLVRLAARAPGPLISYGVTARCDESLRVHGRIASTVSGDAVVATLLGEFEVRVPAMLFPRAIAEAAGGWSTDLRRSQDWDWVLRATEHAPVAGVDAVVYLYRRHGAGMTADVPQSERDARTLIDRYFERHPEQRGTRLHRHARARVALDFAEAHAHAHDYQRAARLLAEAVRVTPRRAATAPFRWAWLRHRVAERARRLARSHRA